MSFFPDGFNPNDPNVGLLDLCEINTPDGPERFIIGTEGLFTDVNGNQWVGSQLLGVGGLGAAIDGSAPEGSARMAFFQDPDASDLIGQVRALGLEYLNGRTIRFLVQPLNSMSEFYAPVYAPIQWLQRTMRTLVFNADGAQDRSIGVTFEAWSENRRAARRVILNTEGHAQLIGEANPSLDHMPTTNYEEEKLFG